MDKVGTIHGDLWSEVRNRHSRRLYLLLTQPELGSDAWVTNVFALVEKKVLFGLLTFTVMDFNRPLVTFRRKNKEDAAQLHAQIRGIVTQEKEDDWCAFLPAPTPPEGYTEVAQRRQITHVGQTHFQEESTGEPCEERHAKFQCGVRCTASYALERCPSLSVVPIHPQKLPARTITRARVPSSLAR